MIVNWGTFTNYVKYNFAEPHLEVKSFSTEFLEQFGNIASNGNNYPILYFEPVSINLDVNVQTITFNAYCLDIIIKDRSNIISILSTTQSILNDLYRWLLNSNSDLGLEIDVLSSSSLDPINNYLLDYVAGWKMNITVELPTSTVCDIPFE